jgi:predicted DsbA family dithiol-disulfide isomerase
MAEAFDHEVTGTPAFLMPSGFVIPGVQDRETMARIATRLLQNAQRPAELGGPRTLEERG